jgi:hypothetical protein
MGKSTKIYQSEHFLPVIFHLATREWDAANEVLELKDTPPYIPIVTYLH